MPSLLTTPTMLAWTFAYERISDGKLVLLSALPREWYTKPFEVRNVGYSGGRINVTSDGKTLTVDFETAPICDFEIAFRDRESVELSDVTVGREHVRETVGNRLVIKGDTKHLQLELKNKKIFDFFTVIC